MRIRGGGRGRLSISTHFVVAVVEPTCDVLLKAVPGLPMSTPDANIAMFG